MQRIITDTYKKGKKHTWDLNKDNPTNQAFNQKIVAVNDVYGWLYHTGILRNVSFEFKDYSDMVFFALDVNDLKPYREQIENSGIKDISLAVHHIFDAEYTPCIYSGAIQLGWTMQTYRDTDGTVNKSWETGLIQDLNNSAVHDILDIRKEKGVKAAVSQAFELSGFEPDLFDKACEYFQDYIDFEDKNTLKFFTLHADTLIYCSEHKKDMLDFDFWVQYETLLGEKITWDEYVAIDNQFDGDPHDVDENDIETISEFKNSLKKCRGSIIITQEEMNNMCISAENRLKKEARKEFQSLADKIQVAETQAGDFLVSSELKIQNQENERF